ncbi:MAG: hypothetical protein IJZ85_10500 [Lachnospiraceae bacterium]|nr:hypothetical protein [Lachnospiraceae bacterium]
MPRRIKWIACLLPLLVGALVYANHLTEKDTAYTTYTYSDVTFLKSIPNRNAYGTGERCTGMQGMAATEDYLYVVKIKGTNTYAVIFQYDVEKGTRKTLKYYPGIDATEQAALDIVQHCNEMTVFTQTDGNKYMLTANGYHPEASSYPGPCLTKLLLDEENAAIRFAGYYNLTRINDEGETVYLSASAIRWVGNSNGFHYYLIKNANDFYWCKIAEGELGGSTAETAVEIAAIHLFTIDNRNAVFADEDGSTYTIDNLENWTNQGFYYNKAEDVIYVPLFDSDGNDNVILVFAMDGMLRIEALEKVTSNQRLTVFPTTLTFHIGYSGQKLFEIESCVFLENQGSEGNLNLFFNTNGSDVSEYEGIWSVNYRQGSFEKPVPIVDEKSIIYTVEYNYNVDGAEQDNWLQSNINGNFSMLRSTTHIDGIATNLRVNQYYREDDCDFTGWHLYRSSDGKWLYADGNWYTEADVPSGIEKKLMEDAERVDQLTKVNGDVITAYAQWLEIDGE